MQAIAEALRDAGIDNADMRFVGSRRGQEETLLGDGPIALTLLPGRGLRRSWSPRAVFDNLGALLGLARAMLLSLVIVRRWKPRVVVSVGGYAAAAMSTAAVVWRRPLVLVDLDAMPSVTHRLLSRFATVRCVAMGTASAHVVVTGAPVRHDLAELDRSPDERQRAKARLSPPIDPERRVVVVMTGSLGATRVNRAVLDLARRWSSRTDIALVHVTGRRDYDMVMSDRPDVVGLDYRVEAFADMVTWWAVADLAICRAGATTIAEITVLSLPAILIPLPTAPGDHQGHNAQALSAVGAAALVPDSVCTGEVLARQADAMLTPELWREMSRSSSLLAQPDAAAAIARVVLTTGRYA
jgi:UDP-N-acetylglucosamine:LPS N-acetylglucosamine transferase